VPYNKYTREILETAVRESWSYAEVLLKLGLRLSGGGHSHIKRRIAAYGINTSHFLGRRANSGNRHRGGPKRTPAEELLTLRDRQAPIIGAHRLRRALLEIGRGYA
jgi:hypothetical protein